MTDELETPPDNVETLEEQMLATYKEMEELEASEEEVTEEGEETSTEDESPEVEEQVVEESEDPKEEVPQKRHKKRRTTIDMTSPVDPPTDWSAEAKEWFKQQPKQYQSETKRVADQFQTWRQKQISSMQREKGEFERHRQGYQGMTQVVERFIPRWAAKGLTPEAAISQFCAFEELVNKDPETAIENLALAKGLQIEIKNSKKSQNGIATQPNISYDQIYSRVRQDLDGEIRQREHTYQVQNLTQEIGQVVKQLQDESNDQGQYMFPDMHSDEFQSQLEPIASGLARANPGLGWREILVRSYKAAGGRVIPGKVSKFAANLSNSKRQELQRRAASSVAGSVSRDTSDMEVIPNESVEQTVARVYAHLNHR